MKRKLSLLMTTCILVTGCSRHSPVPNNQIEYAHVSMAIDECDMDVYVGTVDYIFIGTMTSIMNQQVTYDLPYSRYQITVDENLKGNLISDIEVSKFGGYLKDGTLLLYESDRLKDSELPQLGESYVFMAYAQPDGQLLLSEFFGNVRYQEEPIKQTYLQHIKNQVSSSRERFISKYDQKVSK